MPRRTLWLIFAAALVSFLCYQRVDRNPYGRYFSEVLDQVDRNYMEPVDEEQLFETAVSQVVHRLDGYSSFISRSKASRFHETLGQKFGGIGIEVSLDPKTKELTVMNPLVGTPAYVAGVRSGDRVLSVDGNSTAGFTLEDAVKLLRGEPGEMVLLEVLHPGQDTPTDYEISRALIKVDSVLGDVREADGSWNFFLPGHDRIGLVRITSFGDRTAQELTAALEWLAARDCQRLVIDLRNNSGGLLEAAKQGCDLFLGKGELILSTKRREYREEFRASGRGPYQHLPLVVLVNHFSASASEIMAACLQDHGRARVVGERSWGKGTVQNVIPIQGGKSILTLTTASYWRPSGKNIHRSKTSTPNDTWGVQPSDGCEVKLSEDQTAAWLEAQRKRDSLSPDAEPEASAARSTSATEGASRLSGAREDSDPQLEKAIQLLEAKKST